MTDASTQRWRAHRRISENSGHVISARDQSHLPAVENSQCHSPNADRQLHKHTLLLQALWTSGIPSVRRPLNFVYTSLNYINYLIPVSQPKFRPDAFSFFPTRGEKHLSIYLIAKEIATLFLSLSVGRGFASMTILPCDQIILVLAPDWLLCSTPHNVMNNSQGIHLLYLAVLIRAKSSSLDAN